MMIFQKHQGSNNFVEIRDVSIPDNYEEEMLIHCSFRYIPITEIREVDLDKSLLVRIDGLQSLESRCRRVYPDMKLVKNLLRDMVNCFDEIKEYMLNPEGLLLGMDTIYYSEESDEYRFIYVPGNSRGFRKQIKNLFEDIMRVYDHKDSEGVMYLYDMYSRFLNDNFTPDMLSRLVTGRDFRGYTQDKYSNKMSEHLENQGNQGNKYNLYPDSSDTSIDQKSYMTSNNRNNTPGPKRYEIYREDKNNKNIEHLSDNKIDKTMYFLIYAAAIVVMLVMLIFFGVSSLRFSVLVFISVTVYTVADIIHKKNDLEIDMSMQSISKNEYEMHELKPDISVETDMKEEEQRNGENYSNMYLKQERAPGTTVLTPAGSDIVSRLVPRSKDSGLDQIYLIEGETKLGRLDSECDFVLDEPSVSRLHAILDKHGEIVTLTDMGSTNGTYINEDRISEGEVRVLNPGDLVSIANVSYECL